MVVSYRESVPNDLVCWCLLWQYITYIIMDNIWMGPQYHLANANIFMMKNIN